MLRSINTRQGGSGWAQVDMFTIYTPPIRDNEAQEEEHPRRSSTLSWMCIGVAAIEMIAMVVMLAGR
ncbi:hypothetical protein ACFLS1_01905 [Verrucomicrobiota bacterium]